MIRNIFKKFISFLAKAAIKKHQMTIFVVSGWYGTEITREFIYSSLNTQFDVRRNLKNPWWDMSYPLTILGYEDKRRNPIEWIGLMFKASAQLLFGKKHKHYLVLNINYSYPHSIKYWSSFITPSYLVLTSYKKNYDFINKLMTVTIKNKGKIIYNRKDKDLLKDIFKNYQKVYCFGKNDAKCSLLISEDESKASFECYKETVELSKHVLPWVDNDILASVLLLGKIKNISLNDTLYAIIKYGLPPRLLAQMKADLKD